MNEIQPGTEPTVSPVTVISPSKDENGKFGWATNLSSLAVLLATAAYLIGFVVVNSSLFKYGMVPYDFLQPRYVSAGLLYLAATVGFTSIIFLLIYLAKEKHFPGDTANAEIKSGWVIFFVFSTLGSTASWLLPKSENIEWWLTGLQHPAWILALAVVCLNTTIMPIPKRLSRCSLWWRKHLWEAGWLSWIIFFLMLVSSMARLGTAFAFYPLFLIGIWFFSSGFRSNLKQEAAVSENTNGVVYGITNLCLSIYVYGTLTYPLISPHVGGGKPLLVSLY